eukprot:TRINITY_DN2181_c0_g1_i4.p1 TRINITY_DN2181_c0_g1~~TRINITY_DN2181_c0_g1_i4.p1  ORF type:complete len:344 (-),score=120.54 TRINITY_DN2181_c0_g1_i4:111-1064(-)
MTQLLITIGILLVNVIGLRCLDDAEWWKTLMLLSLLPVAVLLVTLLVYAPETPRWLITQHRYDEANEALVKLRGSKFPQLIQREMEDLTSSVASASPDIESRMQEAKWTDIFRYPALKPFMICVSLQLFQQWSGINAFIFHTKELFSSSQGDDGGKQAADGAIYVALCQVLATFVASMVMEKKGRKFFLLLSSVGLTASCLVMAFLYRMNASQEYKVITMMAYITTFSFGWGPIPWFICSEIAPPKVRGTALSLVVVTNWLSAFAVTSSFAAMNDALSDSGTFFLFAAVSVLSGFFVVFFVPETKGKSLEDIQREFL